MGFIAFIANVGSCTGRTMECPKCHFDHPQQVSECLKCGIIFEKYLAFQKAVDEVKDVTPERSPGDVVAAHTKAEHEFWCRVFALPVALAFGWVINWAMPTLTAFLEMWVHETGHATTAWLCGYPAIPTAWFTPTFERQRALSVFLAVGLVVGGYFAVRFERWFWVAVSAGVLLLVIAGSMQHDYDFQVYTHFWGEGGAYVWSTILMLTFYSRRNSPMTKNQIRWALLILGAMAFWNVYSRWSGGFENIAQFLEDTDERGPSDMRTLTVLYSWPIYVLIHRYRDVGYTCLAVLTGAYAAGLLQAQRMKTSLAEELRGFSPRSKSAAAR